MTKLGELPVDAEMGGSWDSNSRTYIPPATQGGGTWTTIKKTADESRASNIVLANDNTLIVPVLANTQYRIRFFIFFRTNATADFKYRVYQTAGLTTRVLRRILRVVGGAVGTVSPTVAVATAFDAVAGVALAGTGNDGLYEEDMILQVGAVGGSVAFAWAQNTSNVGAASVLEGSYVESMVI